MGLLIQHLPEQRHGSFWWRILNPQRLSVPEVQKKKNESLILGASLITGVSLVTGMSLVSGVCLLSGKPLAEGNREKHKNHNEIGV